MAPTWLFLGGAVGFPRNEPLRTGLGGVKKAGEAAGMLFMGALVVMPEEKDLHRINLHLF